MPRANARLSNMATGANTRYRYDPDTFRLIHLKTTRRPSEFPDDCPANPSATRESCGLQNLHYTYDPVGNITHIRDERTRTDLLQETGASNRVTTTSMIHCTASTKATGRDDIWVKTVRARPSRLTNSTPGYLNLETGNAMGRYEEEIRLRRRRQHPQDAASRYRPRPSRLDKKLQLRRAQPARPNESQQPAYLHPGLTPIDWSRITTILTATWIRCPT